MAEVLPAPIHADSPFSTISLRSSSHPELPSLDTSIPYTDRTQSKSPFGRVEYDPAYCHTVPSTAPSSPLLSHSTSSQRPSLSSTPASSVSLDNGNDGEDDDIQFPAFDASGLEKVEASVPLGSIVDDEPPSQPGVSHVEDVPDLPHKVNDDQAVEREPTRHVDYLSHEWQEEDIWSSWRYVVARRKHLPNSTRLENASWRTWVKAKNNLKTISPEALNWLKDCDVTWLYGPLQTDNKKRFSTATSPPPSRLSHSPSFINKKPILKKKSASAAILERSISKNSLLKQAGALLRAQQSSPAIRPTFNRGLSDFSVATYSGTSVANTPAENDVGSIRHVVTWTDLHSPTESKHVEFNETVRQVQAIESDEDDKEAEPAPEVFSDDEDDDGGLMMRPSTPRQSNRGTPRGSFSNECKTIADLPSTTLKYRNDTPEPNEPQQTQTHSSSWSSGKRLSPSPSQETLRPPRPNHNFLIDDDPEDPEIQSWQPRSFGGSPDVAFESPYDHEDQPSPGMRRTESGMFMPYDENEPGAVIQNSIFRQALNVANTIKDIGYVVWNAGWNKKTS